MQIESEKILYKKKIAFWKIFLYFFVIQTILLIIWWLTFLTWNISPYNDDFKNEWNKNYIAWNNEYVKNIINNYDIEISKVSECEERWFYNKSDLLYFCDNGIVYVFKTTKDINSLIIEKKEQLIEYIYITIIISILLLIVLWISNKTLFTKWAWIWWLNQSIKELESVIDEINEYISTNWNRLEYRIPTLFSLALSVIETEIDFFNRYWNKIKKMSELAKNNHLNNASNQLHILYKEMEKKYFIKKNKIFHALWSELSLLLTKYNTSLLWFIIFNIFTIIISAYILFLLYSINWNNLTIKESFNAIINIFTLREAWVEYFNVYQNYFIIFIQFVSYIYLLVFISLITNKK